MKCPIKSLLQQVNRNAVFPQVLISPPGGSTKLETEADNHGGDLHSALGSKSTPTRGTRRLKPERVMELHKLPLHLKPHHLSHSPQSVDLSSPLICHFSLHIPTSQLFFFHMQAPLARLLTLLISFQCFYLRFHLTPLPQLSLHQPNFLS